MLTVAHIRAAIPDALQTIDLDGFGPKQMGKVRDMYRVGNQRILIATDRLSVFDQVVGCIPYKGQVLNQLSGWWFEHTRQDIANHVVSIPDPNVTIAHETQPLPVEVVVRGYITGVTRTSLWSLYEQGHRRPYGIPLPEGLRKNDPLPTPLITPTTKATGGGHDEQLTREAIIQQGLVPEPLWEQVETAALTLFARGQELARQAGLLLVDTKYEFGFHDGRLVVIDELHTPDSSRYWTRDSYERGDEQPEHMDKEYVRLWFAQQGYRGDGSPPPMPADLIAEVAARYIAVYERITGHTFVPGETPIAERIQRALEQYRFSV